MVKNVLNVTGEQSGKVALAHMLVGKLKDYQGNIFYYRNKNSLALKNMVKYVNQDVFLFHDSMANSILMEYEDVSLEKIGTEEG